MDFFVNKDFNSSKYDIYSVFDSPFRIYGLMHDGDCFYRLPFDVAENCNNGVVHHNRQTAGGRIRFVTDATELWFSAEMHNIDHMTHFAMSGFAGFDIYEGIGDKSIYSATIFPDFDLGPHLEGKASLFGKGKRLITINFPTYSGVKNVHIALPKDVIIESPCEYTYSKPIVFYGSSITQGGCSSRPGNAYETILSRRLDFDFVNLGFSGSARAEDAIIEYLSGLDMSVFVLDYDHNAPDVEHLKNTHSKLFSAVRKSKPDLPILMLTRPKYHLTDEEIQRKAIVEKTYLDAIAVGDKNAYFIAGNDLISEDAIESATVDNTHPNDAGFLSMANAIEPVLKKILNKL